MKIINTIAVFFAASIIGVSAVSTVETPSYTNIEENNKINNIVPKKADVPTSTTNTFTHSYNNIFAAYRTDSYLTISVDLHFTLTKETTTVNHFFINEFAADIYFKEFTPNNLNTPNNVKTIKKSKTYDSLSFDSVSYYNFSFEYDFSNISSCSFNYSSDIYFYDGDDGAINDLFYYFYGDNQMIYTTGTYTCVNGLYGYMGTINLSSNFDDYKMFFESDSDAAWQNGYDTGYESGKIYQKEEDQEALTTQYNNGYSIGYSEGETAGYNKGKIEAENTSDTFENLFFGILDAPFKVFKEIFDFEILGIHVASVGCAILAIVLIAWVIRKFI